MLIALAFSAATLLVESSQQAKQAPDTGEFREAIHRLAVESPDVTRQYGSLASEPFESRAHLFAVLPSSMKSAVWTHHLLIAITNHPEFSVEQRSLIYEAIRLLSPELYETSASEGHSSAVFETVHDFTRRAQLLFPRNVALALFVEVGSAIPIPAHPERGVVALSRESTSGSATESDRRTLKRDGIAPRPIKITPQAWNCSCSVASDWCGMGFECTSAGCQVEYSNCGTFLLFDCNGVCVWSG